MSDRFNCVQSVTSALAMKPETEAAVADLISRLRRRANGAHLEKDLLMEEAAEVLEFMFDQLNEISADMAKTLRLLTGGMQ